MAEDEVRSGTDGQGDAQAGSAAGEGGSAAGSAGFDAKTDAAFAKLNAPDDDTPPVADDGAGSDKAPVPAGQPDSPVARLTKAQKAAAKELGLSDKDLEGLGEKAPVVLDAHAKRVSTLAGTLGSEKQRSKRYAEALTKLSQDANGKPDADGDTSAPQLGEVTEGDLLDGSLAAMKVNENFKVLEARFETRLQAVASGKEPTDTTGVEVEKFFNALDPELYPELAGDNADPEDQADLVDKAAVWMRDRRSAGRRATLTQAFRAVLPQPPSELLADRVVKRYAEKVGQYRSGATRNPDGRNAVPPSNRDKEGWAKLGKLSVFQPD